MESKIVHRQKTDLRRNFQNALLPVVGVMAPEIIVFVVFHVYKSSFIHRSKYTAFVNKIEHRGQKVIINHFHQFTSSDSNDFFGNNVL